MKPINIEPEEFVSKTGIKYRREKVTFDDGYVHITDWEEVR